MRKIHLLVFGFLFSVGLFAQTTTFEGAWFDIDYPSNFQVYPSLKSLTSVDGCESVRFKSPDETVEFYVFSPQWNGEPSDISLKSNEKQISSDSKIPGRITHTWWTIAANDESYLRSYYQVTDNDLGTTYVIGIKYLNKDALAKYKEDYLLFKASLMQYAD